MDPVLFCMRNVNTFYTVLTADVKSDLKLQFVLKKRIIKKCFYFSDTHIFHSLVFFPL